MQNEEPGRDHCQDRKGRAGEDRDVTPADAQDGGRRGAESESRDGDEQPPVGDGYQRLLGRSVHAR